jgi:hypothetical protein
VSRHSAPLLVHLVADLMSPIKRDVDNTPPKPSRESCPSSSSFTFFPAFSRPAAPIVAEKMNTEVGPYISWLASKGMMHPGEINQCPSGCPSSHLLLSLSFVLFFCCCRSIQCSLKRRDGRRGGKKVSERLDAEKVDLTYSYCCCSFLTCQR